MLAPAAFALPLAAPLPVVEFSVAAPFKILFAVTLNSVEPDNLLKVTPTVCSSNSVDSPLLGAAVCPPKPTM